MTCVSATAFHHRTDRPEFSQCRLCSISLRNVCSLSEIQNVAWLRDMNQFKQTILYAWGVSHVDLWCRFVCGFEQVSRFAVNGVGLQ